MTPTPSQAAEKAIREALAAGPTPGTWETNGPFVNSSAVYGIADCSHADVAANWAGSDYTTDSYAEANAALIAACNPKAMTAVLSQLAELRAEVERLKADLNDAKELADSEGSRAVAYLRRARKAEAALQVIARWDLPPTGKFWDEEKTRPTSYEAEYGSNGARDYMRNLAIAALAADGKDGAR